MKKIILPFISVLLFFSLFLPASMIEAENTRNVGTVIINADGVNVREGPGLNYPVVGTVNKNNHYPFIDEQDGWFKIQLPSGENAWVASWLATKGEQKIERNANEKQASEIAVVTTNRLRIRKGPDTTEKIIGYLNHGDTVKIISSLDDWVQITNPNGDGWVSAQFISLEQASGQTSIERNIGSGVVITETLNIRSSPSIRAEIVGKLYANNKVTITSEKDDWLEITYGQLNGWIHKQYVHIEQDKQRLKSQDTLEFPESIKGKIGTITASSLKVRKKNSLKAKVIGTVTKGQHFHIVEEDNNWVKIEYKPKKFGWIAGWYVEKRTQQEKISKNKKQRIKKSDAIILYDQTNVREAADARSAVIQQVNKGERYRIVGIENEWYEIKLKNRTRAFVAGWLVSTSGSIPKIERSGPEMYLKNKTIVIDPGHGGRDNGTVGASGTIEKQASLKTAQVVIEKLRAAGANVISTRTNDSYVSLGERVMMSNYHEADAFISIHFDNSDDARVQGMTSYYYYEPYKKMAENIHSEIVSATKLRDRGARHGDYFVLRENRHNSILLELGYLSNPTEEAYITTPHFHELVANGIYHGLAHYFK